MNTSEKTKKEYIDAIESMDNAVETDIPSMQRSNRESIIKDWDEHSAAATASEQGIALTDEHMDVVHRLRKHYLDHGEVSGRELTDMLEAEYHEHGGKKYLHCLFPEGPVKQGMRIAGLPMPAHTEDASFGVSR